MGPLLEGNHDLKPHPFSSIEISDQNVHNCLVYSGDSSNVMLYSFCKNLNVKPQVFKKKIIQLDRSHVKVIRDLKDVLIRLSLNSKVYQTIDVIVVDIPEAYGAILSRYWSAKLNGYFTTHWYHLWLPYKGHSNKIKVECERYMKHTINDLNDLNEPVMLSNSSMGNFCFDTFFWELEAELYPLADSHNQYELLHSTQIAKHNYTIVDSCTKVDSSDYTNVVSSSSNFCLELTDLDIWTLYFDISRNKEGAGVGYLLIDPYINK